MCCGHWITVGTPEAIAPAEAAVAPRAAPRGDERRAAPRVFSIPPGAPFLPTLAEALLSTAGSCPVSAATAIRWRWPTSRSTCRRAAPRAHCAASSSSLPAAGSAILPIIRPLGEFDEDERAVRCRRRRRRSISRRRSPRIDRLLLLAPLVRAWKQPPAGACRGALRRRARRAGLRRRCHLAGARSRRADGRGRDRRLATGRGSPSWSPAILPAGGR